MARDAYRDAGVDIRAGDAFVERIKPLAASASRPEVLGGLGGFGGLFKVPEGYRDPVMVAGTDGVGTKLLVAHQFGTHHTIGIDLVAMCVNDIAVSGAEPLFFLDYLATGKLDVAAAEQVIAGIVRGCEQAGCALLGGETAEMPGMYSPGHYDLAGFAVGIVERDQILDGSRVSLGDRLVAVPSSGLHSNGYSLARKLLLTDDVDTSSLGRSLEDELLEPTRIYVRLLDEVRRKYDLRAAAHITGGGLHGNIPRVFGPGLGARLWRGSWTIPPVFRLMQKLGKLSERELLTTFNCGVGLVLVVAEEQAKDLAEHVDGAVIGEVRDTVGVEVS